MAQSPQPDRSQKEKPDSLLNRLLDGVEKVGNKLPDPAVMFFGLLIIVWLMSWLLSGVSFDEKHPLTGDSIGVINLLSGTEFAAFLANMVDTFMGFAPLGVVLVAMLGVGVAERSGFINGLFAIQGWILSE